MSNYQALATYFSIETALENRAGDKKQNSKPISHRYNRLPLLPSGPGGVQQELVVPICRSKDKGKFHSGGFLCCPFVAFLSLLHLRVSAANSITEDSYH